MTALRTADVLVVGGGPAGAVTAAALACRELRVLLADDDSSSESHDVLIRAPAIDRMESLGMPVNSLVRRISRIDVKFGQRTGRPIVEPGAAVCDWAELRRVLTRGATAAGAGYVSGTVSAVSATPGGWQARIAAGGGAGDLVLNVRHIVVATGGGGSFGLPQTDTASAGVACAQRVTGIRLGARILLVMTAPAAADPQEPPTCVWALPGANGDATLGVARVGDRTPPHAEELISRALRALTLADPALSAARPAGGVVCGSLNTGFSPERLRGSGPLLVGDAAGLVSPFTGEGISYAVQSGWLAANAIARHAADPEQARDSYVHGLTSTFVGYFETARHAARRYHLTWRILAAAAESDHPFFTKGRRAILLPEGLTGLTAAERLDPASPDAVVLGPFLVACDEVAITTIRGEWPFLARWLMAGQGFTHHRLRPAVLFLAGFLAQGARPPATSATIGAAIELAQLGALSLLGVPAPERSPTRGVDWAYAATILAGDFLLAQASRLVAHSAPEISWSFADWVGELTALRAARLGTPAGTPAGSVFASLFEFPARVGAELGGGSPTTVRALRGFGRRCGYAFVHAEDVLALRGARTRLDISLETMLQARASAIPESLGREFVTMDQLRGSPPLRLEALTAASANCHRNWQDALGHVTRVPDSRAARILRQFAAAIAEPVTVSDEASPA